MSLPMRKDAYEKPVQTIIPREGVAHETARDEAFSQGSRLRGFPQESTPQAPTVGNKPK